MSLLSLLSLLFMLTHVHVKFAQIRPPVEDKPSVESASVRSSIASLPALFIFLLPFSVDTRFSGFYYSVSSYLAYFSFIPFIFFCLFWVFIAGRTFL